MKGKFVSLLIVSFLISGFLWAQNKKDTYPQWSLRTLPSSFLDPIDAGAMLGVNYRWTDRWSASFEPTWIFYTYTRNDDGRFYHPSGLKIRVDGRHHMKWELFGMETFIGLELHHKRTSIIPLATFGFNCVGGNCAYFAHTSYKELKRELGANFKWGTLGSISKNDRWWLEFYGGLGFKAMKYKETDIPIGGTFIIIPERNFIEQAFVNQNRDEFFMPMLPGGIKLLFILR
jgi:hypothetical protein